MAVLQEIVRNLAFLLLLGFFLELLLPNSSFKGYLKVVVGLFIIITLLNPLLEIVNRGISLELPLSSELARGELNEIMRESEKIILKQEKDALNLAKSQLEKQIEGMISFTYGINQPVVKLTLTDKELEEQEIIQVNVKLNLEGNESPVEGIESVETVLVGKEIGPDTAEKGPLELKKSNDLITEMKLKIGAYLDINPDKIIIKLENN